VREQTSCSSGAEGTEVVGASRNVDSEDSKELLVLFVLTFHW
jgi:hypothetical protein